MDPLKRAFIAICLLITFGAHELNANNDNYLLRSNREATSRTVRAGRRAKDENEFNNIFNITA